MLEGGRSGQGRGTADGILGSLLKRCPILTLHRRYLHLLLSYLLSEELNTLSFLLVA